MNTDQENTSTSETPKIPHGALTVTAGSPSTYHQDPEGKIVLGRVQGTTEQVAAFLGGLHAAQSNINPVDKDGVNKFQNYKYASTEAIIIEARAALLGGGMILVKGGQIIQTTQMDGMTKALDGYVLYHTAGAFMHIQAETPICRTESQKEGKWSKDWDKAAAGAFTTGLGYTLRDLLLIPRVNAEMDGDSEPHPNAPRGEDSPQPTTPTPKPDTSGENILDSQGSLLIRIAEAYAKRGEEADLEIAEMIRADLGLGITQGEAAKLIKEHSSILTKKA